MSFIAFSIPSSLAIVNSITISGTEIVPSGSDPNRLRAGTDQLLNKADSGNLAAQIAIAAGVLSLNGATGAVTLTSAPSPAGYIGVSTSGTTIYISGVSAPNGVLALATHTTSGGGIGLGPDNSIFRDAGGSLNFGGQTTMAAIVRAAVSTTSARSFLQLLDSAGSGWDLSTNVDSSSRGFTIRNVGAATVNAFTIAPVTLLASFTSGVQLGITGDYTTNRAASVAQLLAASGWLTNSAISNVVYTTGAQTIGGAKTFAGSNLILTGGNLGVGTTSPLSIFHIDSGVLSGVGPQLFIRNSAVGGLNNAADLVFGTSSSFNASTYAARIRAIMTSMPNLASDLTFSTYNGTTDNEWVRITASGNVGLGTSAPTATLQVSGAGTPTFRVDGTSFLTGNLRLGKNAQIEQENSALNIAGILGLDSSNFVAVGGGGNLNGVYLVTNTILCTNGGKVGIGTNNPQEKLHVTGASFRVDGNSYLGVMSGAVGIGTSGVGAAGTLTMASGIILGTSNVTGGGIAFGPQYLYTPDNNTLTYRSNTPNTAMRLNSNGTDRVQFGAGNTTDFFIDTLSVGGTINFRSSNQIQAMAIGPDQSITGSRWIAAQSYRVAVSGVAIPLIGATNTGTYNIDFTNSAALQTITITGATLFSGVNYVAGGAVTMRVNVSGSNAVPIRFPAAWVNGWVTTVPTGLATGRFAVMTLNTFTANDSGCAVAWAVAP